MAFFQRFNYFGQLPPPPPPPYPGAPPPPEPQPPYEPFPPSEPPPYPEEVEPSLYEPQPMPPEPIPEEPIPPYQMPPAPIPGYGVSIPEEEVNNMALGQDTQYWLDWYANAATVWGPDSSYVQRVMASAGVAIPTEVKEEAVVSYQTQVEESFQASADYAGVTVEELASAYVTAGGIVPPGAAATIETPEYQEWVSTQTQAELEEVYTSQAEASAAIRAEQEATGQAAIATSNALQSLRDAGTTFTPDEGGALFDATYNEVFNTILEQQASGIILTSAQQRATAQAIMANQLAAIRATAIGEGGIVTTAGISTAGFDLGSNWPILAIVGVGALMMFKKEPGSKPKRKNRGRRK